MIELNTHEPAGGAVAEKRTCSVSRALSSSVVFQSFGEFVECAGLDSTILQKLGPEIDLLCLS